MNFFRSALNALIAPKLPDAACVVSGYALAMAQNRGRGAWRSACEPLPPKLLSPAFDRPNVADMEQAVNLLSDVAQRSGLGRERRWAVGLPNETARVSIVTMDEGVGEGKETSEMLSWKLERVAGVSADRLRISSSQLTPVNGLRRFLASVMVEDVAREYDELFRRLGWQAGLMWPRTLCETVWLRHAAALPEQALLSVSDDVLSVIILQNGEPLLVRTVPLADEDPAEALLRVLLFYQARGSENSTARLILPEQTHLSRFEVLAVGLPLSQEQLRQCFQEAFNMPPVFLDPVQLGYPAQHLAASFPQFAAVAGLISLAA
jgi:hypothetical protein